MTSIDYTIQLGARLGMQYTDEQTDFIVDFNNPMISFSLPGTGKTATAVSGLITAERFYKIPANKIYALSFTNNATAELGVRHLKACNTLGIKQRVNFMTLHMVCSNLLRENAHRIGIDYYRVDKTKKTESIVEFIEETCAEMGLILKRTQPKQILAAIEYCNSSFLFDKDNVESRYIFKKAGISFDDFMKLRSQIYEISRATGKVPPGYIMLFALELLNTCPDVVENFRKGCELMLVDEFQDMSLLQLAIVNRLCDRVVVIGDMNQQIYAFNGACQEISTRFKEMYPNCKEHNLTQSFRCAKKIAEYSAKIIHRNKSGGEHLKGTSEEGYVYETNTNDLDAVIGQLADGFDRNNRFDMTYYFLYRNNFSAFRIAERLWERRVPFYVNGYVRMNAQSIVKDLCQMVDLLRSPANFDNLWILCRFIKEFKDCKSSESIPLFKPMEMLGCSFMSVDFKYDDHAEVAELYEFFFEIQERLKRSEPIYPIFMDLYDIYFDNYLKGWVNKMAINPVLILEALRICCGDRNFYEFINNEREKEEFIKDNERRRKGVRLMTFHSAKGLEADVVHIYDADKGIIPSDSKLREMHELGCSYDVAREVRNERSLVYVACTRAKKELHVHYGDELSPIFKDSADYNRWDVLFDEASYSFDDAAYFNRFTKGEWNKSEGSCDDF